MMNIDLIHILTCNLSFLSPLGGAYSRGSAPEATLDGGIMAHGRAFQDPPSFLADEICVGDHNESAAAYGES